MARWLHPPAIAAICLLGAAGCASGKTALPAPESGPLPPAGGLDARLAFAEQLLDEDDLDRAIAVLEEAAAEAPDRPDVRFRLGMAYTRKNATVGVVQKLQYSKRIREAFELAIELDPGYVDPRFGLMQFHLQAPAIAGGKVAEARRQAEAIAAIDPIAGYRARAILARHDGELDVAEAEIETGLAAAPENGRLLLLGAEIAEQRNDCDTALDRLADLAASDPDDPWSWYRLGRARVRCQADPALAESALTRFLDAAPGDSPRHGAAWYDLGRSRERAGRIEAAVEAYGRAAEILPDSDPPREAIRRLQAGAGD